MALSCRSADYKPNAPPQQKLYMYVCDQDFTRLIEEEMAWTEGLLCS